MLNTSSIQLYLKYGENMELKNVTFLVIGELYLAIDSYYEKVFNLDNITFNILKAIKDKNDMKIVEMQYGIELVKKAIRNWKKLQRKGDRKNRGQNDTENIDFFEDKDREKELVEGVFLVSQSCNMKCRYCYGESGEFGNKGFMDKKMAEEYFRLFLKLGGSLKLQKVRFLGGEPFMNFPIIQYIVSLWEEWKKDYPSKTVLFSVTTNGTMFTDEILRYIAEKKISITISLDGPETIQNQNRKFKNESPTFSSVLAGMDMLRKYKINFAVRSTFTRTNDIDSIYQYFETENFAASHVLPADFPLEFPVRNYQLDLESYDRYIDKEKEIFEKGYKDLNNGDTETFCAKQLKVALESIKIRKEYYPFKCGAGWWIVAFSSDGYIYPCHRMVGNSLFRIGGIHKGIDYGALKQLYIKLFSNSESCTICWANPFCKKRCLAERMNQNGEVIDLCDSLCNIYKDRLGNLLRLYITCNRSI